MSTQDLPHLKPAISTVLRAYGLGWVLTTAPGLIAVLVKAAMAKKQRSSAIQKAILLTAPKLLKRSIVNNGLPLLLATSVGGQRFLRYVYQKYVHKQLSVKSAIFWSSFLSILSVQKLYPNTKTLEVTFFVLVRAFDVFAHRLYGSVKVRQKVPEWMLEYGNIFIFMLASTEIIFSWFYEPQRLPKSYAQWITNMSGIDDSLLKALRAIREGTFVYGKDTGAGDILGNMCEKLGLPRSYGDPVTGRINCMVIHEGNPYGCEANAMMRFLKGFIKIFPVYFGVHLAPPLLFRTSRLIQDPVNSLAHILMASVRSSAFLGTYIGIIWYSICLVRTRIGHQLLGIDQSILDNTWPPLVGSMLCGLSLLIESRHRRGEMTLYVVPRALFSITERVLHPLKQTAWWNKFGSKYTEATVFAASMTVVLHALHKDKEMVRPSIRGLMSWVLKKEMDENNRLKETKKHEQDDERHLEVKIKK